MFHTHDRCIVEVLDHGFKASAYAEQVFKLLLVSRNALLTVKQPNEIVALCMAYIAQIFFD
jgi:hypothetical protein